MKNFFLLFFLTFLVLSCSKKETFIPPEKVLPLNQLYNSAFKEYKKGSLTEAIDKFKILQINYPYSIWASRANLMVAYIYYDNGEYILSLENLKKFKEFYPTHKDLPYVEYLIGLCLYEQIETIARDQTNSKLALQQFTNVIKKYPKSSYAEEAEFKIDLIKEQLAGKEMYIARYYQKRKKWTPAISRLQNIVKKYDTTIFIEEALHRLVEINYYLGNIDLAKKYASILGFNHNDSSWYKKSYKIVGEKNYSIQKEIDKKKNKKKLLDMFKLSK